MMNIFVEHDGPYVPRSIFRKRPVSGLHQQQQQHQPETCPCCGASLSSEPSAAPDLDSYSSYSYPAAATQSNSDEPDADHSTLEDTPPAEPAQENHFTHELQPDTDTDPEPEPPSQLQLQPECQPQLQVEYQPQAQVECVASTPNDGTPFAEPSEFEAHGTSEPDQLPAGTSQVMIPIDRVLEVFCSLYECIEQVLVFNPSIRQRIYDRLLKCLHSMLSPEELAQLPGISNAQPEGT